MEGEFAGKSQPFSQPDVLLVDHHSVEHITLFFVVAHEAGHIALNHLGSTSGNEFAADRALDRISRTNLDAEGVSLFFPFLGYWVPNKADFESELEYQIYLGTESAYPSTSSRLTMLSSEISRLASGVNDVKRVASSMDSFAKAIDTETGNPKLFWDVLAKDSSVLAERKVGP